MKILMTGATGFLGRRLLVELLAAGHRVVCAGRQPPDCADPHCSWLKLDFASTPPEVWRAHLHGVDAVVNLVGIFREQASATFEAMHVRGPIALFDACYSAGVQRIVQVSALGADFRAEIPFLASKYQADRHLLSLPLDACVAQPSLVFGVDGASTRRLMSLASMPVLLLPAGGGQRIQPVHVDDAVRALLVMLATPLGALRGRRIPLVGPQPLTLADYLGALRLSMGLPAPSLTLNVPAWMVRCAAAVNGWRREAWLDRSTWALLQQGGTADTAPFTALLGRPPRRVGDFVAAENRGALRLQARLDWLQPLLRLSLALVWLGAALTAFFFPADQSLALLARVGVPPKLQPLLLQGAIGLDLLLGVLTLCRFSGQRWLWLVQGLLVLVYSAVIAWRLPEFWFHPFGPMSKNLPILALLVLLWCLEAGKPRRHLWIT